MSAQREVPEGGVYVPPRELEKLTEDLQRIAERLQQHSFASSSSNATDAHGGSSSTHASQGKSAADGSRSNERRATRPAMYPHEPHPREDALERHKFHETDLLEALRLETFQGFYNLAALLLVFNIGYMTVRNVVEKGWRVSLEPLVCEEFLLDALLAGILIGSIVILAYVVHVFTRWFAHGKIRSRTLLALYCTVQLVAFVGPLVVMYNTKIAPLATASSILVMAVLSLKSHSYVATNFALSTQMHRLEQERQQQIQRKQQQSRMHESKAETTSGAERTSSQNTQELTTTTTQCSTTHEECTTQVSTETRISPAMEDKGGEWETPKKTTKPIVIPNTENSPDESPKRRPRRRKGTQRATSNSKLQAESSYESSEITYFDSKEIHEIPIDNTAEIGNFNARSVRDFPRNVTLGDFTYFLLAPTLVYEPYYPRSGSIRHVLLFTSANLLYS
eukprot:gb/GECG01001438.1/.p1 GENE.gb/GECG01001438.1/~~gb/GECG01001438.1/.p1  ORF type:complete len:450 (+),score=55.47 gb/GECG01001438.1/:1-1350(+)